MSVAACLVNWEEVCKTKDQCVLGILNLKNMNVAL